MQPVLSTLPNSGLPLAKKPVEDQLTRAAGLMIVTPSGEALFLRYAPDHDHSGEWAWPAGGLEGDEEARDAAVRETREETGWIPNEKIKEVDSSQDEIDFTTFATATGNQFIPELSDEHDSWCWAPLSNPPHPMHPGAQKTLKGIVDTDEIMDVIGQDALNVGVVSSYVSSLKQAIHDNDKFDALIRQLKGEGSVRTEEMREIAKAFLGYEIAKSKGRTQALGAIVDRQALEARQTARMKTNAWDQAPIAHPKAANIASRSELNSIGLPKPIPSPHGEFRAINESYAHGGTTGPEAKQSSQANRYIDSGGLTEHDRERTGKSKAVLGKDAVKKEASKGRFFDAKPWPKDEDEIDSEKEQVELKRKAKDAEYVEKPHIGRLPPREAERLSRDAEDASSLESLHQFADEMEAFRQGYKAKPKAVNPHSEHSSAYAAWERGKAKRLTISSKEIAKDAEDYRSERGFVAKLTDEKGSTIETSPLMISRNSAQRWLDEKAVKLKRLGRAVQGTIRESFMDPAYIHTDAYALDESSVRSFDQDGRLHVSTTNISKATVNPYKGSEIPDYEKLGLEPNKIYQLLRHPDELEKAAPTFNNIPLLSKHVPITADTHKPELVIGSTGTDASFEFPYLKNSLVVWTKDAIDDIESGKKKELSSAYRYTPNMAPAYLYRAEMTPGTWEGMPYDGIMRDIRANHIALVKEGRAGHDVVVADSANPELVAGRKRKRRVMSTMTKTAANTVLVLSSYIRPKLAQDQKVNLLSVVEGLTAKNFDERRSGIIREVRKLTKGKLANDASIGEIAEVLDLLEAHPDTGEDAPVTDVQEAMMSEMTDVPGAGQISGQGSPGGDRRARDNRRARDTYDRKARDRKARDAFPPPQDREDDRDQEGEDRRARDADPTAAVESFLKDKVSGSDLQHVCNLMRGGATEDDSLSDGGDTEPHAEGEEVLEELGASHGAEDDPSNSDIERSREWHVGESEEAGAGHSGKTVQDRQAYDKRGAKDRRAKDRKRAHDEPPPFKGMPKVGEGPDKRAMDAAVKIAVEQATNNQREIRKAERDVRPWVGELAMDEAKCPEDVYAAALKARNIKIDGVHPSAYSVILKNLPLPGQGANRSSSPRVAMDAASRASFNDRFPNAGRIGLL